MNDHLYALSLSEKPRKDKLACKSCLKLISDQNYHCEECDEFILHKSCAETPDQIKAIAQNCPQYLREPSPSVEDNIERSSKSLTCHETNLEKDHDEG